MSFGAQQFWKAIQIWLKNSHVVNRRLSGVLQLFVLRLLPTSVLSNFSNIVKTLFQLDYELLSSENIKEILSIINFENDYVSMNKDEFEADFHKDFSKSCGLHTYLIIQKLLPRNVKYKDTYRLILLDTYSNIATFINISEKSDKFLLCPEHPYSLVLDKNEIVLKTPFDTPEDASMQWLNEKLIPKILKWASSDISNKNGMAEGSLNLIPLEDYNDLYHELKLKYGKNIVEIWPETTDPSKFVYEDVAIATYLLLLWRAERKESGNPNKQSFVDLGCGNGLLVYILCSEGHFGKGLDVRKRGIWDMYPEFVKLEVETIIPSKNYVLKDTDWIIGNHSDELTPWIPVIAANSSYDCKFFLLPCCAYEFDGQKYQRQNSSKSQYNEYLGYVKEICDVCCIDTKVDRLKIPSTKRTCFVGTTRSYSREETQLRLADLYRFVDDKCKEISSSIDTIHDADQMSSNMKIRESVEKVRNCTKIEKNVIEEIVNLISTRLLVEKNIVNKDWNAGCCLSLNEISKLIPSDLLKLLKKECGGLQTLLRNNHNIFEVVSGNVKLRYPRTKSEVFDKLTKDKRNKKNLNIELAQKQCWFFKNHPDGCPLTADLCSYLHENNNH